MYTVTYYAIDRNRPKFSFTTYIKHELIILCCDLDILLRTVHSQLI